MLGTRMSIQAASPPVGPSSSTSCRELPALTHTQVCVVVCLCVCGGGELGGVKGIKRGMPMSIQQQPPPPPKTNTNTCPPPKQHHHPATHPTHPPTHFDLCVNPPPSLTHTGKPVKYDEDDCVINAEGWSKTVAHTEWFRTPLPSCLPPSLLPPSLPPFSLCVSLCFAPLSTLPPTHTQASESNMMKTTV
jgi:hypothetical protein